MTLTVRNFTIECWTPAEADPARSRDVLDRTLAGIRRDLPQVLRHALSDKDDKKDIVFVEQLAFEATISADWSEDAIAAEVGRQVLRKLWAHLSDPDTQRFADEAELLARFLLDVADGAAFTRGWHRFFDGLKALPTSAIIRTLIERDAQAALVALARLDRASTEKIVAQMNDGDLRRALAAIVAGSATAIFGTDRPSAATARHHIALAVALFRQTGFSADSTTLPLADALLAMAQSGAPLEDAPGSLARHGGVWLLLPHLLDHAPATILIALALTAGRDAREVWRDGLLRDALGISSEHDEFGDASRTSNGPRVAASAPRPFAVRRRDQKHVLAAAAALEIPASVLRAPMRLATHALRYYASRLPGFSESSFAHLWTNLLSTPATIRAGANQFLVGLAPPPLDVVWRISGAGAANYELADGRRVIVEVRR